jgi:hypothetical protein
MSSTLRLISWRLLAATQCLTHNLSLDKSVISQGLILVCYLHYLDSIERTSLQSSSSRILRCVRNIFLRTRYHGYVFNSLVKAQHNSAFHVTMGTCSTPLPADGQIATFRRHVTIFILTHSASQKPKMNSFDTRSILHTHERTLLVSFFISRASEIKVSFLLQKFRKCYTCFKLFSM